MRKDPSQSVARHPECTTPESWVFDFIDFRLREPINVPLMPTDDLRERFLEYCDFLQDLCTDLDLDTDDLREVLRELDYVSVMVYLQLARLKIVEGARFLCWRTLHLLSNEKYEWETPELRQLQIWIKRIEILQVGINETYNRIIEQKEIGFGDME